MMVLKTAAPSVLVQKPIEEMAGIVPHQHDPDREARTGQNHMDDSVSDLESFDPHEWKPDKEADHDRAKSNPS